MLKLRVLIEVGVACNIIHNLMKKRTKKKWNEMRATYTSKTNSFLSKEQPARKPPVNMHFFCCLCFLCGIKNTIFVGSTYTRRDKPLVTTHV